jgi:hypothetical protein
MLSRTIALMICVYFVSAAQAEAPSCDAFMQRLQGAGKALLFPLPAVKIERTPFGDDSFWVSYDYGPDKAGGEGKLDCKDGKVQDYQIDYPFNETFDDMIHRQHIASAAVYAYTGQPALQVVKIVSDAMKKRPNNIKDDGPEVRLSKEHGVAFYYSTMIIDVWTD